MLARMTATQAKWAERVREWRASDKSAEEFAAEREFEGSTLRYWASRLKSDAERALSPPTTIARVVRRRSRKPRVEVAGAPAMVVDQLDVVLGNARIVVRRGFDPELLRQVVTALGTAT
jgi:hypothetical protein